MMPDPIPVKPEVPKEQPIPVQQMVSGTWREMIVRWLFDQSVSTVLLVAILGAIAHGVPTYILPAIEKGYERNAESLERTSKIYTDSLKDRDKLLEELHERDRKVWERIATTLEGKKP